MKIPDRKLNRLAGYDYSRDGLYFVTIVVLNDIGTIVNERWQWLWQQYPYVDLGAYVVMPNHIHALIGTNNPVGNGRDRSLSRITRYIADSNESACR